MKRKEKSELVMKFEKKLLFLIFYKKTNFKTLIKCFTHKENNDSMLHPYDAIDFVFKVKVHAISCQLCTKKKKINYIELCLSYFFSLVKLKYWILNCKHVMQMSTNRPVYALCTLCIHASFGSFLDSFHFKCGMNDAQFWV